MKKLNLLLTLLFCISINAQLIIDKSDLEEFSFFYSDSANGEFSFGDYKPKDLKSLDDGSILVAAELSINFPSAYKTPQTYDSTYFANSKVYSEKTHISSGTIFKLNSSIEKEWEVIFKGKRIEKILKTTDEKILIVGEDVSMDFVWLAELNENGIIAWEKQYSYKNEMKIADVIIDENNDVYLLIEASHKIPIKIEKSYGKRWIKYFKNSELNSHLALMKINSKGNKEWTEVIDKRKKYDKYGYKLISDESSIYLSFAYEGFEKDSLIKGKKISQFSKSGKKISSENIDNEEIILFNNGLITITPSIKAQAKLYNNGTLIDSLEFEHSDRGISIDKLIKSQNQYFILASKSNRMRGSILINLTSDLKFNQYSIIPIDDFQRSIGAITFNNGQVIILAECSREMEQISNKSVRYIKLIKL